MQRKAQSALEYMMTYGWAILIIVIVAAVLYSLGIFNPTASTGPAVTGFTPFNAIAQTCGPTKGLQIQFGNDAGSTATINWIAVTTGTGLSAASANGTRGKVLVGSTWYLSGGGAVTSGNSFIVNTTSFGGETCPTTGGHYSATVEIGYSTSSSLGTVKQVATGTVSGTVSST